MKLRQLRNATIVLTLGEHRLLVDPMLSAPGTLPGFKVLGGGRRANPLSALPAGADEALASVTAVIVTHEHPDHPDGAALRWIRARGLSVWASGVDAPSLARKGLDARALGDGALGLGVEAIPSRHGRGALGWLMGPVAGFYLAHSDEPSVYLTGDAVLTPSVLDALERLRPDVVVAPAGAANLGFGGDILFSVDELIALARRAPGAVVLNHLEALDHCPTTRAALRERVAREGLAGRVHVPEDGEELAFERRGAGERAPHPAPRATPARRPGLQKWMTAPFTAR